MDGADSHLNSDDSEDDDTAPVKPKKKRLKVPHNDDEESGNESLQDQEDSRGTSAADMMAAAAFGGGARGANNGGSEDQYSETSSRRRKHAYKEAFGGVRGVNCVGCALATRIVPVERFIKENIGRMNEETLWKMAALCYKKEVAEPCETEGVHVPGWGWKDIKTHYTHHSTQNQIGRHQMIRQLTMMRAQAETRLVRVDNGERELDRGGAELMLKVREKFARLPIRRYFSHTPTYHRSWRPSRASASCSRASRATPRTSRRW